MRKRCWFLSMACLLLQGMLQPVPAHGCSHALPSAHFWIDQRPGVSDAQFLDGELGILDPGLDLAYALIAFRQLAGLGIPDSARRAFEATLSDGTDRSWERASSAPSWYQRRREIPDLTDPPIPSVWRRQLTQEGGYTHYSTYLNCNQDAFRAAGERLRELVARSGRRSPRVRRWVQAQDLVFSNCSGERQIPASAPADWPASERADRDYQIAAAHFYAGDFVEAQRLFGQISKDPASRWRQLGSYLVARAMVRQALVGGGPRQELLAEAEEYLIGILRDSSLAEVHGAATGTLSYVRAKRDPVSERRRLEGELLAPEPGADIERIWLDYRYLGPGGGAFSEWWGAFAGARPEAAEAALARWLERRELPWLVVAAVRSRGDSPHAGRIVDELAKIGADSPAYLTAAYHRARLLVELGQTDCARSLLTHVSKGPEHLSPADRNRIATLRLRVARNLDELVSLSQLSLVATGWHDHDGGPLIPEPDWFRAPAPGERLLSEQAAAVLNRSVPVERLVEVALHPGWAERPRRAVALAAWTRSLLLEDFATASLLHPLLRRIAPELEPAIERCSHAKTPAERRFVVALTLLQLPGLSPWVRAGLGRLDGWDGELTNLTSLTAYRDNWWCRRGGEEATPPSFLLPDDAARLALSDLDHRGPGTKALGRAVLGWADDHRDDERVPEALHLVVWATRHSTCVEGGRLVDFGDVSKAAFVRLHRRYPRSPWTAKTPYWFR